MSDHRKPFVPGFETREAAVRAGAKFFAKTNGKKGIENRDFHIVTNEHGRFHFAPGAAAEIRYNS